eukprot:TRINITY_DN24783_c0_g1_i1.p1 TRINITY_DN24783_c0_g1~~TRINITY_DN24783_c0_g1_i1.p1  ORF type:complete len:408 (+),score=135.97 TRINITY_DN24783_c0_g1_i1:47-1225(+)
MGDVGPTCLADIVPGKDIEGDDGSDPSVPPDWLDRDRYARGRQAFEAHAFQFLLTWHFSLAMGFAVRPLLEALVFTGRSSTPATALKRYLSTYKFLAHWHLGDVFNPTCTAYEKAQTVRGYHAQARAAMEAQLGGTWLSQYDMCVVQTGFMGALVVAPQTFGLRLTDEQRSDYVYFWRCVGRQLGVMDKFNLCGRGEAVAAHITWEVLDEVVAPDEADPPEPDYDTIAHAYLTGMNPLGPCANMWSIPAMLTYAFAFLGKKYSGALTCADYIRLAGYHTVRLLVVYAPGFAWLANNVVLAATYLLLALPDPSAREGCCPAVPGTPGPCRRRRAAPVTLTLTPARRACYAAAAVCGAVLLCVMAAGYVAACGAAVVYAVSYFIGTVLVPQLSR